VGESLENRQELAAGRSWRRKTCSFAVGQQVRR
jgi:hypothetical protein